MICTCLWKETVLLLFLLSKLGSAGALAPPAPPIPQAQFKDVSDLDLLEILIAMSWLWNGRFLTSLAKYTFNCACYLKITPPGSTLLLQLRIKKRPTADTGYLVSMLLSLSKWEWRPIFICLCIKFYHKPILNSTLKSPWPRARGNRLEYSAPKNRLFLWKIRWQKKIKKNPDMKSNFLDQNT